MNPSWKDLGLLALAVVGCSLALPALIVAGMWILELAPK